MRQVTFRSAALKTLRKMPANTARRIVGKVEAYAANPISQANNTAAYKGLPNGVRLRIGDWRVIMIEGDVLQVVKIAPRGSVY